MSDESSIELEYLSKLKFYNDRLEYGGMTYAYIDIVGLDYYAVRTKHSVNFIPVGESHEAYIKLHFLDRPSILIDQERRFFRNKQKSSEAVMRAAGIIAEITFTERYGRYESQISEKKFVEFDGYQFHIDGDLFINGKQICNLKDKSVTKSLGVFHCSVSFKAPGLFGFQKTFNHLIDLRYNRDCFIKFMNDVYGISWEGEPVRMKRKRVTEDDVHRAIIKLCARLCKIDGLVTADEVRRVKEYFGITESTLPGASTLFQEYANKDLSNKVLANEILEIFDGNPEPLHSIFSGLVQVAIADDELHRSEELFLLEVGEVFKIPKSELLALINALRAEYRKGATRENYDDLDMCYQILGLSPGASIDDVKSAYRQKARMHHPDILRSTGIDPEKIKEGERILVIISNAYATITQSLQ